MNLASTGKRAVRTQFGTICWRKKDGEVQVLLITSRRTRRWIIPKGWPIDEATPSEAAQKEAWEEAGAKGKALETCLGIYSYTKDVNGKRNLPCIVAVFPMQVKGLEKDWPEKAERKRKWVSLKKAANMVDEPELRSMLKTFNPKAL